MMMMMMMTMMMKTYHRAHTLPVDRYKWIVSENVLLEISAQESVRVIPTETVHQLCQIIGTKRHKFDVFVLGNANNNINKKF